MEKPTPSELSPEEELYLASLVYHEGFKTLVKLMEKRCRAATEEIVRVKPDDSERDKKVNNLQIVAYAVNQFVATLLKDVQWQVDKAKSAEPVNTTQF